MNIARCYHENKQIEVDKRPCFQIHCENMIDITYNGDFYIKSGFVYCCSYRCYKKTFYKYWDSCDDYTNPVELYGGKLNEK